jgi:hypothetical protein
MTCKDVSVLIGLFFLFFFGIKAFGKRWMIAFSVLLFLLFYFFGKS